MHFRFMSRRDAALISEYYLRNHDHLQPWDPARPEGFHSAVAWFDRLVLREQEQQEGRAAYFLAVDETQERVLAICTLTGVLRGAFLACYMGYSVAKSEEGSGLMTRLCQHAMAHAFGPMGLHRIMANYMPANHRSGRLLEKLGFQREGFARDYLFINGRWEDHVMTSLINPLDPNAL